jgi:hypothetical protein
MTSNLERMRKEFGDEYPQAATMLGRRLVLTHEGDFLRTFSTEDRKEQLYVSRFQDGSASITLAEVVAAWPDWSAGKRHEFCSACGWLEGQDLPDILRFVVRQGARHAATVALEIAHHVPREEAFALLCESLRTSSGPDSTILAQAIAATRHGQARQVLLDHLAAIWSAEDLWAHDEFLNWRAYAATCCIRHLIGLQAPAMDFEEKVRLLAAHPCRGNRDSCSRSLRQHYPWLPEAEQFRPWQIGGE